MYNAKNDGCKVIILLSHLGYGADKYCAQLMPDVDLIIGAHSHTFLYDDSPPYYDSQWQTSYASGPYPTWVEVGGGKKIPVVQVSIGASLRQWRWLSMMHDCLTPGHGRHWESVAITVPHCGSFCHA